MKLYMHVQRQKQRSRRKNSHYVVCDNYVTMSDGTGIVHIAPAFGEDDSRLGRKYDLPYLQFVDGAGNMTEETEFAGCVYSSRRQIHLSLMS